MGFVFVPVPGETVGQRVGRRPLADHIGGERRLGLTLATRPWILSVIQRLEVSVVNLQLVCSTQLQAHRMQATRADRITDICGLSQNREARDDPVAYKAVAVR